MHTLGEVDWGEQGREAVIDSQALGQFSLSYSESALAEMKAHAIATYPEECCGFFYGSEDSMRTVTVSQAVKNAYEGDRRRRFAISPLDYLKAERYALEQGLTLLGIYHSHPNHQAIPSRHDLKQAQPFFSYLILSVKEQEVPEFRSWRVNETGKFEEEGIGVA